MTQKNEELGSILGGGGDSDGGEVESPLAIESDEKNCVKRRTIVNPKVDTTALLDKTKDKKQMTWRRKKINKRRNVSS